VQEESVEVGLEVGCLLEADWARKKELTWHSVVNWVGRGWKDLMRGDCSQQKVIHVHPMKKKINKIQ
jgi:hypothetical protein